MWPFAIAFLVTIVNLLNVNYALDSGHDPEINMTTVQMAQWWGYTDANTVYATTEDGYILEMHHIPYGRNGKGNDGNQRPVVFMQHGLEAASDCFTWNLPNQSLAFIFADLGFDVWLGNTRGNRYSVRHVNMSSSNKTFWEFSWDEMVKYDLDAMINTVLNFTNTSSLYYIGHSQGTLIMFSKLATDPLFHTKIKKFFALAPVGTVKNVGGLTGYLAGQLFWETYLGLELLGVGEFGPHDVIMESVAEYICSQDSKKRKRYVHPHRYDDGQELCNNLMFQIMGPNSLQTNTSRIPIYIEHVPSGTSTQNMLHWIQMVRSGLQQAYDYLSPDKNIQHYNSTTPPIYNISNVNAPTYLFYSNLDYLADLEDIHSHILPNLNPNILMGNYYVENFNHADFVNGLRAPDEVYAPIAKIIQEDFYSQY